MSQSASVNDLAARFWAGIKELSPLWATLLGDESSSDRWDDPGPAGRAREAALVASVLAEAGAIDDADLDVEDRITLDLVTLIARTRARGHELDLWHFDAVDQMAGPQANWLLLYSIPSDTSVSSTHGRSASGTIQSGAR